MVQKLFSIYTEPEESHNLHVEVGNNHIACWCDAEGKGFTAFEYFTFVYDNTEGSFIDIFREIKRRSILLSNKLASEEIVWENANFMCVPQPVFTEDSAKSLLGLTNSPGFQSAPMYDSLGDVVLTYSADSILYKIVRENLPAAKHTHKFYRFLQQRSEEADYLQIQFYQSYFLLTAIKANALQLATVFRFATPQEAVYHIVNTIEKLAMPKEETVTYVSGFIDEGSSLYKELYQYVGNLQPTQTGKIKEEHPAHYFTTYNYA